MTDELVDGLEQAVDLWDRIQERKRQSITHQLTDRQLSDWLAEHVMGWRQQGGAVWWRQQRGAVWLLLTHTKGE